MPRRWLIMGSIFALPIGIGSGLASAFLLESLRIATDLQGDHPWLIFFLPLAGALIAWLYRDYGATAAGGNNVILDQIHEPSRIGSVPFRMFPLVLVSTLLTHLFGGSAGREGTAVQMGGAIAGWLARILKVSHDQLRIMLMCGVSGGFASVFGTPLAGAVFGMEMLALGGIRYDALIPCLVAALAGDLIVQYLDVSHAHYQISSVLPELSLQTVVLVAIAGIAFGLASLLFSEATATVERISKHLVPNAIWRTFLGGFVVIGVTLILGTRIYNGLSLPLLASTFSGEHVPTFAFLFKIVLTAITLGVGFKGGEVTPLFVIGATLGITLSGPLDLPPDFLAALGFVAVFAAAANTPLACVVMGAELFGTNGIVFVGIAVFIAYTISGHRGIYHSQRVVSTKDLQMDSPLIGTTLHDIRASRTPRSLRTDRIRRRS